MGLRPLLTQKSILRWTRASREANVPRIVAARAKGVRPADKPHSSFFFFLAVFTATRMGRLNGTNPAPGFCC